MSAAATRRVSRPLAAVDRGARASRLSPPLVAAAGAVALAVLVRLWIAAGNSTALFDADQAVTGIAAQRIGAGDAFPVFFPGQSYMGALEQYGQALILLVAPDTKLSLQLLGVLLGGATVWVVYLLGRRVTASAWGGALAAAVTAIGPWYWLDKGVKSHGAYAAGTLIALVALLLAYQLRPRDRSAPLVAAGVGLCLGLVVWELWLAAYIAIPALVWALAAARRDPVLLLFGAAGALVGAAPFIGQRFAEGWGQPVSAGAPPGGSTLAERAEGLFDPVLPSFVGVARGDGSAVFGWLPPAVATATVIGLLALAAWRRRRGLAALVTLRTDARAPVDAVLAGLLVAPLLYVASAATWYTAEPRYLFTLAPLAALAIAAGVVALPAPGRLPVAIAMLVAVAALTVVNARETARSLPWTVTLVGGAPIDMASLPESVRALEDGGVDAAWADYWLAYPLTYLSGGDMAVAPFSNSRLPSIDDRVRADDAPALIAPGGPDADRMRAALETSGTRYREWGAGSLVVFSEMDPVRAPRDLDLRGP